MRRFYPTMRLPSRMGFSERTGRGNTLSQMQGMEWTPMDQRYARGPIRGECIAEIEDDVEQGGNSCRCAVCLYLVFSGLSDTFPRLSAFGAKLTCTFVYLRPPRSEFLAGLATAFFHPGPRGTGARRLAVNVPAGLRVSLASKVA